MVNSQYFSPIHPPLTSKAGSGTSRSHVWEVRHAGLLGIKYEVAVRSDLVEKAELEDGKQILRGVVEAAVLGYVLPNST
jgi:TATA-binding protein-associated factor